MSLRLHYERSFDFAADSDDVLESKARRAVRFERAAFPPLGVLTVAAMLPNTWAIRLVDMDVRRLFDADISWADYVLVSAMIIHGRSVQDDVIPRCKRLAKAIIGGRPLFTTGYEEFATDIHAVVGECEGLFGQLVCDIESGLLQSRYESRHGFPDVTKTPVPRLDLIDPRHYATMSIQFSRGCPFDCEFCDIIVMNGRRQRAKTPDQMIAELDALLAIHWRGTVFFVDDNFIGNKKLVKELLRTLVARRERRQPQVDFITEASVNLADDQ